MSIAWRRAGASLLSCNSAVGIPQPPIPRVHRRDDKVSSFKISAQIAALKAAQTRCRRAMEWLSEGPFERRFSVRHGSPIACGTLARRLSQGFAMTGKRGDAGARAGSDMRTWGRADRAKRSRS
jgi:hypothetical protein